MEKPKAYLVRMSIKNGDVQIDEDEVASVLSGITNGHAVKVRRGIINPSFFVGICEDVDRLKFYYEEFNRIKHENEQNEKYGFNGGYRKELPQFVKLKDIFEGVNLKLGNNQKLIQ